MLIKIKRDSGFADRLRAYKVILDESVICKIEDGQEINYSVSSGTHQLYLKIDWCRSNKIVFEIGDSNVEFECGNSLRGFKIIFAIFYSTIFKNN